MIWNGTIHHKGIKWHYPSDVELCVDIQMVVCVCTCLCVHEDIEHTEHEHTWYLVWCIVCAANDKIIFFKWNNLMNLGFPLFFPGCYS